MEWTKLSETSFKAGYRRMLTRIFRLPDGSEHEFTIKADGDPVCILPLTTDNRVVLAKQYRPGPEKVLLELPGGGIEPGETPAEAAARELLEETGYQGNVQSVGTVLVSAYSTATRHVFVATGCVKVQEPKGDATEFTEAVTMSLEEFRWHLRGGQLTDVQTGYLALDKLGLLNERI